MKCFYFYTVSKLTKKRVRQMKAKNLGRLGARLVTIGSNVRWCYGKQYRTNHEI